MCPHWETVAFSFFSEKVTARQAEEGGMEEKIGVMIVDDEYIVREDIKSIVDWESRGFYLVGEASNGRQGLEMFQKRRPDLVITDIKMPVMDGLEMAKKILEIEPRTTFILLTAYDEFDFARTAMRMGISHYLLKHEIDAESLGALLEEIALQTQSHLESKWRSAALYAREAVLGGLPGDDVGKRFLEELLQKSMVAFLLFRGGRPASLQELQAIAACRKKVVTADLLLEMDKTIVVLFCFSVPSELAYYHSVSLYINQLMTDLESQKYPMDVAVSGRLKDPASLQEAFRQARSSLETAIFHKEHGRIIRGGGKTSREIDHAGVYEFLLLLKSRLVKKDYDAAFRDCEKYVLEECVPQKRVDQFRLWRTFVVGMLEDHITRENDFRVGMTDSLKEESDTVFLFLEKLEHLMRPLSQASGKSFSRSMRKAVAYVETHYAENITLDDVADQLNMNAVYLGQLFKKEMLIPFKQYLTEIRIEKAKELLRSGEYKVYQVSGMVGYQTTQYFSTVFKKVTGVSPAEYVQNQ